MTIYLHQRVSLFAIIFDGKTKKAFYISGMHAIKKIVVIGPESTGKSTLCEQLAQHYKTIWCPEYAREYLLQHGTHYSYEDLLSIAKGQLSLEDSALTEIERSVDRNTATNPLLFIDTEMYVMKVWCEVAFEQCHTWILKQIAQRNYDMHLLCDVDLPWTKDELREYPDLVYRKKLFKIYKDILVNSGSKWSVISGTDSERLQTAVSILNTVFEKK